ncbi:MAG: hypothetical protein E7369_00965 [Clostridiales bacterium]|nr:hypothetical protein [Clostridiales bacterium]
MNIKESNLINKLNQLSTDYASKKNLPKVKFYGGIYTEILQNIITAYYPYSKVCLLASERTYLKYGKNFSGAVKGAGGRFVGITLDVLGLSDIDDVAPLFNLPDDVRIIAVCDKELLGVATYFATIRSLTVIYVPFTLDLSVVYSPKFNLKNGDVVDRVKLSAEKIVILDNNLIDAKTIPSTYSLVISGLVSLADYRIYTTANKIKPDKDCYLLAKTCVNKAYGVIKEKPSDRAGVLMEASCGFGIANAVTGGTLNDFSAVEQACRLIKSENRILLSEKILGLYSVGFSSDKDLLFTHDYLKRCEHVSDKTGYNLSQIASGLESQSRTYKKYEGGLKSVCEKIGVESKENLKLFASIKNTYSKLGGKDSAANSEDIKNAVYYSGDTPFYSNGLSCLREIGVLENIF